jgi:hypothetical protein
VAALGLLLLPSGFSTQLRSAHPEFVRSKVNQQVIEDYLLEHDLRATVVNLDTAFAAVKGELVLDESKLIPDSDWQSGAWRNNVWVPDGTGAAQRRNVDPSRVVSEEKKVSKRVSQMDSREFLSNLNESPSFRKKVDQSV